MDSAFDNGAFGALQAYVVPVMPIVALFLAGAHISLPTLHDMFFDEQRLQEEIPSTPWIGALRKANWIIAVLLLTSYLHCLHNFGMVCKSLHSSLCATSLIYLLTTFTVLFIRRHREQQPFQNEAKGEEQKADDAGPSIEEDYTWTWWKLFILSLVSPPWCAWGMRHVGMQQVLILDTAVLLWDTLRMPSTMILVLLSVLLINQLRRGGGGEHLNVQTEIERDLSRGKTYPPPYPNGWYKVEDSYALRKGELKRLSCLGQELVLFRTNDRQGKACVLDAYCPHLGAHLGEGGTVVGDCVQCPFHKWQLRGDGSITHIPYPGSCAKLPVGPQTQAWTTMEMHGMVLIWHDAEKFVNPLFTNVVHSLRRRPPAYYPDHLPQIRSGKCVFQGAWNSRPIRMHIQEFAENSADVQHFGTLHGKLRVPWTSLAVPGITIHHDVTWIPPSRDEGVKNVGLLDDTMCADRKHILEFHDRATLMVLGSQLPFTSAKACVKYIGPGGVVYFVLEKIGGIGDIIIIQTHLPTGPMEQQTQFRYFADRKLPHLLVMYVVGNWISQWQRDIQVWEKKIFQMKPLLVKGDGPIPVLRRWYKQFYSDNSVVIGSHSEDLSW